MPQANDSPNTGNGRLTLLVYGVPSGSDNEHQADS